MSKGLLHECEQTSPKNLWCWQIVCTGNSEVGVIYRYEDATTVSVDHVELISDSQSLQNPANMNGRASPPDLGGSLGPQDTTKLINVAH